MESDGTTRTRSWSICVTGPALQGADCPDGCVSLAGGCSACRARWTQLVQRAEALAEDEPDEPTWPRLSGVEESALRLHVEGEDEQTIRAKLHLGANMSLELPNREEAEAVVVAEVTRRLHAGATRDQLVQRWARERRRRVRRQRLVTWLYGRWLPRGSPGFDEASSLEEACEKAENSPGAGQPSVRLFEALEAGLKRRVGTRLNRLDGEIYDVLHHLATGVRATDPSAPSSGRVARHAACRACHVVFERSRREAIQQFCSTACRKKRMPTIPEGEWAWVCVGGERFSATPGDVRNRQVGDACEECEAFYWRRDDSHRYCDRCGSGGARTARSRRQVV